MEDARRPPCSPLQAWAVAGFQRHLRTEPGYTEAVPSTVRGALTAAAPSVPSTWPGVSLKPVCVSSCVSGLMHQYTTAVWGRLRGCVPGTQAACQRAVSPAPGHLCGGFILHPGPLSGGGVLYPQHPGHLLVPGNRVLSSYVFVTQCCCGLCRKADS